MNRIVTRMCRYTSTFESVSSQDFFPMEEIELNLEGLLNFETGLASLILAHDHTHDHTHHMILAHDRH